MTSRTLVIGIPLPHFSFDNYSFFSAPSLFDYDQVIVELSAVSQAVDQVLAGSQEHRAFDGRLVENEPSGSRTFSLAELLRLRRLEAERLLSRGGVVVCFAYPDVRHAAIEGLGGWSRYDWLPSPDGFSYSGQLAAGHGKLGVEASDEAHPFAHYVREFALRLGFRAYLADEQAAADAQVFARSPGGAAVGLDLAIGPGRVILLPPFASLDHGKDRTPLALVLHECLERLRQQREPPRLIHKEAS